MVYIPKQQILTRIKRYKALNQMRLQHALALMGHEARFCLSVVPVLLHYNHVNLVGFRQDAPHGIDLFSTNQEQRLYLSRAVSLSAPPLTEPASHDILGIYAMGSTSSLGQGAGSDLDLWVCTKEGLSPAQLELLQNKCRLISEYFKSRGIELNLFVTPQDRFTNFQPDSLDEENCGSAQNFFLLDEFYRTSIRICGRFILWYLISSDEEQKDYHAYAQFLLKGITGMPGFCANGISSINSADASAAASMSSLDPALAAAYPNSSIAKLSRGSAETSGSLNHSLRGVAADGSGQLPEGYVPGLRYLEKSRQSALIGQDALAEPVGSLWRTSVGMSNLVASSYQLGATSAARSNATPASTQALAPISAPVAAFSAAAASGPQSQSESEISSNQAAAVARADPAAVAATSVSASESAYLQVAPNSDLSQVQAAQDVLQASEIRIFGTGLDRDLEPALSARGRAATSEFGAPAASTHTTTSSLTAAAPVLASVLVAGFQSAGRLCGARAQQEQWLSPWGSELLNMYQPKQWSRWAKQFQEQQLHGEIELVTDFAADNTLVDEAEYTASDLDETIDGSNWSNWGAPTPIIRFTTHDSGPEIDDVVYKSEYLHSTAKAHVSTHSHNLGQVANRGGVKTKLLPWAQSAMPGLAGAGASGATANLAASKGVSSIYKSSNFEHSVQDLEVIKAQSAVQAQEKVASKHSLELAPSERELLTVSALAEQVSQAVREASNFSDTLGGDVLPDDQAVQDKVQLRTDSYALSAEVVGSSVSEVQTPNGNKVIAQITNGLVTQADASLGTEIAVGSESLVVINAQAPKTHAATTTSSASSYSSSSPQTPLAGGMGPSVTSDDTVLLGASPAAATASLDTSLSQVADAVLEAAHVTNIPATEPGSLAVAESTLHATSDDLSSELENRVKTQGAIAIQAQTASEPMVRSHGVKRRGRHVRALSYASLRRAALQIQRNWHKQHIPKRFKKLSILLSALRQIHQSPQLQQLSYPYLMRYRQHRSYGRYEIQVSSDNASYALHAEPPQTIGVLPLAYPQTSYALPSLWESEEQVAELSLICLTDSLQSLQHLQIPNWQIQATAVTQAQDGSVGFGPVHVTVAHVDQNGVVVDAIYSTDSQRVVYHSEKGEPVTQVTSNGGAAAASAATAGGQANPSATQGQNSSSDATAYGSGAASASAARLSLVGNEGQYQRSGLESVALILGEKALQQPLPGLFDPQFMIKQFAAPLVASATSATSAFGTVGYTAESPATVEVVGFMAFKGVAQPCWFTTNSTPGIVPESYVTFDPVSPASVMLCIEGIGVKSAYITPSSDESDPHQHLNDTNSALWSYSSLRAHSEAKGHILGFEHSFNLKGHLDLHSARVKLHASKRHEGQLWHTGNASSAWATSAASSVAAEPSRMVCFNGEIISEFTSQSSFAESSEYAAAPSSDNSGQTFGQNVVKVLGKLFTHNDEESGCSLAIMTPGMGHNYAKKWRKAWTGSNFSTVSGDHRDAAALAQATLVGFNHNLGLNGAALNTNDATEPSAQGGLSQAAILVDSNESGGFDGSLGDGGANVAFNSEANCTSRLGVSSVLAMAATATASVGRAVGANASIEVTDFAEWLDNGEEKWTESGEIWLENPEQVFEPNSLGQPWALVAWRGLGTQDGSESAGTVQDVANVTGFAWPFDANLSTVTRTPDSLTFTSNPVVNSDPLAGEEAQGGDAAAAGVGMDIHRQEHRLADSPSLSLGRRLVAAVGATPMPFMGGMGFSGLFSAFLQRSEEVWAEQANLKVLEDTDYGLIADEEMSSSMLAEHHTASESENSYETAHLEQGLSLLFSSNRGEGKGSHALKLSGETHTKQHSTVSSGSHAMADATGRNSELTKMEDASLAIPQAVPSALQTQNENHTVSSARTLPAESDSRTSLGANSHSSAHAAASDAADSDASTSAPHLASTVAIPVHGRHYLTPHLLKANDTAYQSAQDPEEELSLEFSMFMGNVVEGSLSTGGIGQTADSVGATSATKAALDASTQGQDATVGYNLSVMSGVSSHESAISTQSPQYCERMDNSGNVTLRSGPARLRTLASAVVREEAASSGSARDTSGLSGALRDKAAKQHADLVRTHAAVSSAAARDSRADGVNSVSHVNSQMGATPNLVQTLGGDNMTAVTHSHSSAFAPAAVTTTSIATTAVSNVSSAVTTTAGSSGYGVYGSRVFKDPNLQVLTDCAAVARAEGWQELEAPLDENEWFDFGSISKCSPTEYFGSGLWLLYKAIDSPFKVVLKILLMEAYSSDYTQNRLLASELKDYMLSHDGYSLDLDAYYLMYLKVSHYLQRNHDPRLTLMRKCFYLKIYMGISQKRPFSNADYRLKRELLNRLSEIWGWSDDFVKQLERVDYWKMAQVRDFYQEVYRALFASYQALLQFSVRHGIEYAITSDDAGILSRKLYATFDRYPGKILIMHTSFSNSLEERHLTFIKPSKTSLCRRGWHLYTTDAEDLGLLNMKAVYIGSRLCEVVTWATLNGLLSPRTVSDVVGAPSMVTPLKIRQLSSDINRVLRPKLTRVSEQSLQRTRELRSCIVMLNLEQDPTAMISNRMLDVDLGSSLCCGRQRICLVGSVDLVLINSWGEVRSITLPDGEDGVVELLATLLRIIGNSINPETNYGPNASEGSEANEADFDLSSIWNSLEVCCYSASYGDLIKYDMELTMRQVIGCLSFNNSSEFMFDVGRNSYMARSNGRRGVTITSKGAFASEEFDIRVLSRYGMRPEYSLQVPAVVDRYATVGIVQYFFSAVAKGQWDIYIINERNEVSIFKNYKGSRAALVNAINRFYTRQSQSQFKEHHFNHFNLPQYFVLSKDQSTLHPFTIRGVD